MNKLVQEISVNAKAAVSVLNSMSAELKNNLLIKATENIHQSRKEILLANNLDVEDALTNSKDDAFVDRLRLDDERIDGMIDTLNNRIKITEDL